VSGVQVDEYYPGAKSARAELAEATALSLARLSEEASYSGKFGSVFAGKYGRLICSSRRSCLAPAGLCGGGIHRRDADRAENRQSIRSRLLDVARAYEKADPDCIRRMIFTPMYAYFPTARQTAAPGPIFASTLKCSCRCLRRNHVFWPVGCPALSLDYVDEETLNCMARLLRHYCSRQTDRLFGAPYELAHLKNRILNRDWLTGYRPPKTAPSAPTNRRYGQAQAAIPRPPLATRLPACAACETTNVLKQQLVDSTGESYSVKLISGDYGDLKPAGRERTSGALDPGRWRRAADPRIQSSISSARAQSRSLEKSLSG